MMTEDYCAILKGPALPDWLISGKDLSDRLTPPPQTNLHRLWKRGENKKQKQKDTYST